MKSRKQFKLIELKPLQFSLNQLIKRLKYLVNKKELNFKCNLLNKSYKRS